MTNRTSGIRSFFRSPAVRSTCRSLGALAVGASLFFVPKQASAQAWLRDRRYQEGEGLRAGDFEFHPAIGGELGYDSNWFLRSDKTDPRFVNGAPQNPPIDGGLLRITPSITMNTVRPKDPTAQPSPLAFNAGLAATYREFFGPKELRDQRNVSGAADVRLDINAGRPIAFGVFGSYSRLIQPTVIGNPDLSFNRSDVGAGADVTVLPGGGTFDMRFGYQIRGALFEDSEGVPYTNFTHEVSVRNRWRFRPRTALFSETTLRWVTYPNAARALNYLNDSTPLRTRFGITGLVTDRFGMLVAAGYGATFFQKPELNSSSQYDSINAQAEGTFYLSQAGGADEPGKATLLLSTISFGYVRDFQNSLLANYYTSNKGYAKIVYQFGNKVLLSLDSYVEGLSYPQPFLSAGGVPVPVTGANGAPTGDFTNYRVGGVLFLEYKVLPALGLNATFDYAQMISDVALNEGGAAPATPGMPAQPQLYDLSWRRFQAFVGARYFF